MNLDEIRIVQSAVFYIFISTPVLRMFYLHLTFKKEKIFLQ